MSAVIVPQQQHQQHQQQQQRAPSMKLTVNTGNWRKTYIRPSATRTVEEKKEVRSAILDSLDRQISILEPKNKNVEEEVPSIIEEAEAEAEAVVEVPFESVLAHQVFKPQSQRQQQIATTPQRQIKRISARSNRILESLDKHLIHNHQEEKGEVEVSTPTTTTTTTTTKSRSPPVRPVTPKRKKKVQQPAIVTKSPSSESAASASNTSKSSSSSSSSSKSPRRAKPPKRSTSSSKSSNNSRQKSPRRRKMDSSIRSSDLDSSKQSMQSGRSSLMDQTLEESSTRRSSMDSTRQSLQSRNSYASTASTTPQHLQPSSEDALASVWSGDEDVAIGNLTPIIMGAPPPSGEISTDHVTNNNNNKKTKKPKKTTKKKGSKLPPKGSSMSSKRSTDSSTFNSSSTTSTTKSMLDASFDKSLSLATSASIDSINNNININNKNSMTIAEEEEADSKNGGWNGGINTSIWNATKQTQQDDTVAIGNLMPAPKANRATTNSKKKSSSSPVVAPAAAAPTPESSSSSEKRNLDNSMDDSDAQFDHFYQQPIQRSSIVSTVQDAVDAFFDQQEDDDDDDFEDFDENDDYDDDSEQNYNELEETEVLEDETEVEDCDLMEASMSLSDIFAQESSQDVMATTMIGNLQPKEPPSKKEEMTLTPRSKGKSSSQQSDDQSSTKKSAMKPKKTSRWSLRSQRTVDADIDKVDKRASTRSHRTIDSFFGSRGQPAEEPEEEKPNSQDLASEQRLAAIFGAKGPSSPIRTHSKSPARPIPSPKTQPPRVESWQQRDTSVSPHASSVIFSPPQTPRADEGHDDPDVASKMRLREIFGADHEFAASPIVTNQHRKQVKQERRGSLSSLHSRMSTKSARSARSIDSNYKKKQSSFGSLHSRLTNRSGRSKERSIDVKSNTNTESSAGGSLHSRFSTRSGRSKERSIDRTSSMGSTKQERRSSVGSLHSRRSMKSADSSVKSKSSKTRKNRSKSPLKRAFSPRNNRSLTPQRISENNATATDDLYPSRPLDDDDLIVAGVLKRYDTNQCRTFEDHQEMAEAELISSITNTSPRELRRLKTKLVKELKVQLGSRAFHANDDEEVQDSDHLIEVYQTNQDDPSDVTSLTSMTSFTNFGGGSTRSGSIGLSNPKSSRTLDRPSNSALNYQHIDDEDTELVFVTKLAIYGGKYSGTVCPISGQPQGSGRMVYRGSKGLYSGEWKQGQWNGKGKHIKANGDYYEGNFLDNLYHGEGVFSYKQSGRFFEGRYVMGERTKGTMRYADGSVYKGQFYHGRRHGRGSYTFKDGSRYKGDFYKDLMQGIGELRFRDGSSYVGEWKNGKHEGQGSMYSPDGMLCWAGMWEDGRQVLA